MTKEGDALYPYDHAIEVAGVVGEAFGAGGGDDYGVGVAEAREAGDVEARLHGKDHAFGNDAVVALVNEGRFVPFQADAVAGVVPLQSLTPSSA